MAPRHKKHSCSPSPPPPALDRLEQLLQGQQQHQQQHSLLDARDRSFCRLLVTTAERRLGQIDAVLERCYSRKKTSKLEARVQAVLRIGAVQLLFLDTAPHAAVKETVDVLWLLQSSSSSSSPQQHQKQIKFVNAILRRLSREGAALLERHTRLTDNAAPWLVDEWNRTWGESVTQGILRAAMTETPRCLSIRKNNNNNNNSAIAVVADCFLDGATEILSQGSVRVLQPPAGPVSSWPLYDEGAWWMQDVSATIPAMALRRELIVKQSSRQQQQQQLHDDPNESSSSILPLRVVDLCAAPGGKTAQLFDYGFQVTAVETSIRRCKRLRENMERLQMDWDVVVADGTEYIPTTTKQPVAGVLVDVPCTATGTASKRPDVLRRDANITSLLDVQYRLACHAADKILQPGGILVYATCSLLKQESEDQVARILARETGAKLQAIPFVPGEIPGFDNAIDEDGNMRVIPGTLPGSLSLCDGFYVAKLKRVD